MDYKAIVFRVEEIEKSNMQGQGGIGISRENDFFFFKIASDKPCSISTMAEWGNLLFFGIRGAWNSGVTW